MAVWHAAAAAVLPALLGGAAAPDISPGDGAVVTDGTVTVSARAGLSGGTLIVDGERRASGRAERLTFAIDGHAVANGTHTVEMTGLIPLNRGEATFRMAVPAYAPAGVVALASGRKLTVVWQRNPEPDVSGYSVAVSAGGRAQAGVDCPDGRCTAALTLPKSAQGEVTVTVVAHRAGAADSGAGAAELVLPAKPAPAPAGDDGEGEGAAPGTGSVPEGSAPGESPTAAPEDSATPSPSEDDDESVAPAPTDTEEDAGPPTPAASVAGASPDDPLPRIIFLTSCAGALLTLLAFAVRALVLRRRPAHAAAHRAVPAEPAPVPPAPLPIIPSGDDTAYREPWT
ncbi:hypothetical protein EDD29_6006 [Actinocorallia herbida]|uniref:Ig-like domain-containing protein n=1 Tax=Actinocorallia herbida TaxID=58109 RepID=A0A3N1D481_9ACTN|nr:hypothetical protein [Actinocorallia herbida]ROO88341.1 hypothetical protein EDD29_6006 [Actinocorallia herbida]